MTGESSSTARWRRMQDLFHLAADQPRDRQAAVLDTACPEDPALVAEVLGMLWEDAEQSFSLDEGLSGHADRLLDASEAGSSVPHSCGRYRLLSMLGQGGMGVVYLAEREDLGNPVAIKLLRDAWMSPARRERFSIEQSTLARLTHSSIARLYDADTLPNGTPWFAMEYVEGASLTAYCHDHKCPLQERLRLFRSVCEAVQYAHQRAVIHRDLKPSNILVKSDGSVRLLDFGIAKQLEDFDTPADQTNTALRFMTPAYAAPEQIRGEQAGVYTDVYALGVILYELVTGELPFDLSAKTPTDAEKIVCAGEPEKPSVLARRKAPFPSWASAPWADLDVLCLAAMHKDAERRYRSVDALIRDLDHFVAQEPLEVRPDSFFYRTGKFVSRNRKTLLVTAMLVASLAGISGVSAVRLARARNAEIASSVRAQRVQQFMLNLFTRGDAAAGPAQDLRVLTLLDRGVQEAQSLNQEPTVQVDLLLTLGRIYQKLGKLDRADSLLQSALNISKAKGASDQISVAKTLIAVGLLRVDQARLADGERLVREGIAHGAHSTADREVFAEASFALGKVLEARGKYPEAVKSLQDAVNMESTAKVANSDLAAALKELADTRFYMGDYDACDLLTRRSMAIHRQMFGPRHPTIADDLMNLGAVQVQRGNYGEAEKYDREALEINRAWYGEDHPETASSHFALGQVLSLEKRFEEAEQLELRALAIQERVYGPNHPRLAMVLNELGNLALQRDQYDRAMEDYRRVTAIWRTAYGDRDFRVAVGIGNVATVYLREEDYSRAEEMFRDAIRRFTEALSAEHFNTGVAQIKLGRTLVKEGRFAEAEKSTLTGVRILSKQTSPSVTWLQSAREDLITIYDRLDRPAMAAQYRQMLAENNGRTR